MKTLFLILILWCGIAANAQLTEAFTDGDFTANPVWTGTASSWTVNGSQQLQSTNSTANAGFYLSTASTVSTAAQWDFWTRLDFNPSGANYVDVFVSANAADLLATATSGYFIRIGGTPDEVSLYRKDGATLTKLIDGVDGITNRSNNTLRIRLVRNAANAFTLLRDETGTGTAFVSEGSATDATYATGTHFGFAVRQSTASFFGRHYFDDISIAPYIPDVTPPAVASAVALSATAVDVLFSEAVELVSAEVEANYSLSPGGTVPSTAIRDGANPALVHLTFATPLTNGTTYALTATGVKDLWGNATPGTAATFVYYLAARYDVVISELMPDPTPAVGLPAVEWIELHNRSLFPISLAGWRLRVGNGNSGPLPAFTLQKDSFVIVAAAANAAALSSFGTVLGLSTMPALPNGGDTLSLRNAHGATMHAIAYTPDWYRDAAKNDGGWSLEMIDRNQPCADAENWRASTDAKGGTPGKANSVKGTLADGTAPAALAAYPLGDTAILVEWSETIDSAVGASVARYGLSPALSIVSAAVLPPLFRQVRLRLAAPMAPGTVYMLTVMAMRDCAGNVGMEDTLRFGLPGAVAAGDVVINEILYNPRSGGDDYVELYNRSAKIIDLSTLVLANRDGSGTPASLRRLTTAPRLLLPGGYLVLTSDAPALAIHYHLRHPRAVLTLPSLPSYTDDGTTVLLLDTAGRTVDEVRYDKGWQFALISNPEGVALERIDPDGPSNDRQNWHSAAATAGYGTPGYENSQYKKLAGSGAAFELRSPIFSPDGDGVEDVAVFSYALVQSGFVANVTVFDAAGRPVRRLVRNALLGVQGGWTWDGLDENRQRLPAGTYVVWAEFFDLRGKREVFKKAVVLGRR